MSSPIAPRRERAGNLDSARARVSTWDPSMGVPPGDDVDERRGAKARQTSTAQPGSPLAPPVTMATTWAARIIVSEIAAA